MAGDISRRAFVGGLLAATVVGFDTDQRRWVTAHDLSLRASALAADFPAFEGELRTDEASLDAAADDFGHIVHRKPMAVLLPGSVHDILTLVRFARRHHLRVAARGQGHSTQGQAQAEAGVIIDMATFAGIHAVNANDALVGGGVRWGDLLQPTLPLGLTPPRSPISSISAWGGRSSRARAGNDPTCFMPSVPDSASLASSSGRGCV